MLLNPKLCSTGEVDDELPDYRNIIYQFIMNNRITAPLPLNITGDTMSVNRYCMAELYQLTDLKYMLD